MSEPHHVDVSRDLTIDDVVRASRFRCRLQLTAETRHKLDEVRTAVIDRENDRDERIYGFNTGFGDNRTRPTVPKDQRGVIQDNLILSHASGWGEPISVEVVRAAMVIRARTLAIGHSGIRSALLSALCSLYNSSLVPVVPSFGSVGASGDLAPLSHMALPLMARGEVWVDDGQILPASRALIQARGVELLSYRPSDEFPGVEGPESVFGPKEGLALNNGTAFMAAWLALSVESFENVLWHANLALALNTEAMCGVMDVYEPQVQAIRGHWGVQQCAAAVAGHLHDSKLVLRRHEAEPGSLAARTLPGSGIVDSVQDDYSLRAASVVHGTAAQCLAGVRSTVEAELNSVTDNPVVVDRDVVLSAAHFHGMPLAFAADQLRTAAAILGGISERRVTKLMNDRRNYGLPRHLVIGDETGVQSGWMIAQYLCASMVNELKTRSMPYCVGNVTTGNEAEDFVSMGANACRSTYDCVGILQGVVAVELAAAVRALLIRTGTVGSDLSTQGLSTAAQRAIAAFHDAGIEVGHTDDRPLEPLIRQSASLIETGTLRTKPSAGSQSGASL